MDIIEILKSGISILTPVEYVIIFVAMILSTVITEFIKRHVVWKKDGIKQGIINLSIWGGSVEVPKVVIIGFIISSLSSIGGLSIYGTEVLKSIYISLIIGALTPVVYKLTIILCRKQGWHEIANFISGERREKVREVA